MDFAEVNGVTVLRFPNLARFADIRHAVFTRRGGFSKGAYRSLNIAFGVGDDDTDVKRNRRLMSRCLADGDLSFMHQVHGTDVLTMDQSEDCNAVLPQTEGNVGDAMVCNIRGRSIVVQVADCQAVLLFDPIKRVVANVHSGWRGSINNIIGLTVARMQQSFGSRPCDLVAGIGPSLGPCCAEFINYTDEIPETLWAYKTDVNYFNFWAISHDQLSDAGVPADNIHVSGLCTRCNPELFFSYRGQRRTGRFAAVIGLK